MMLAATLLLLYVHTFEKKSNCWLSEYVHNKAQ